MSGSQRVDQADSRSGRMTAEEINRLFPVTKVIQYKNGVCEVIRTSVIQNVSRETIGGDRGEIQYLSGRARSHLAFVVAATAVEFRSILTLTYGKTYCTDISVSKSHLNSMLTWIRTHYDSLSYVWVLEFQKRGAPHYHILLSIEAGDIVERKELAYKWARLVSPSSGAVDLKGDEVLWREERLKVYNVHKHPKTWENIRAKDGATRYITKYCLKTTQKRVPSHFTNVGRFYGMSQSVKDSIDKIAEIELDNDGLRLVLSTLEHRTAGWEVVPKYVFGLELFQPDD